MNIQIEDSKEQLYYDLLNLLQDLKLTQGPMAVNSTLQRHPVVKKFILDTQKRILENIEQDIENA